MRVALNELGLIQTISTYFRWCKQLAVFSLTQSHSEAVCLEEIHDHLGRIERSHQSFIISILNLEYQVSRDAKIHCIDSHGARPIMSNTPIKDVADDAASIFIQRRITSANLRFLHTLEFVSQNPLFDPMRDTR